MRLEPLPAQAAFRHEGASDGFEVVFSRHLDSGVALRGATTAVEAGVAWAVGYEVVLDKAWQTLTVTAHLRGPRGDRIMRAHRSERGGWEVDGQQRPDLDGCIDIDLESSAVTNTLPIHRLPVDDGARHDVPAAFVRVDSLTVERLEQSYRYLGPAVDGHRFDYRSASFDFACELVFDTSGLVDDYPGIARRHGRPR